MSGRRIRDQQGYSLPELLVVIAIGSIVLFGVFTLIQVTAQSSARTAARVDANQRARPVLERIIDQLHSTCLTPSTVPVLAGSTGESISFTHQTGATVTPVPTLRTLTLANGTLSDAVYPRVGTPGNYSFSTTPSETRQLLTGVAPATLGNPPATVPVFQYYRFQGAEISPALPTPLSAADAAQTVQVTVSFAASPLGNPVRDPKSAANVTSSALLRFSPPSDSPTTVNKPCA